MPPTGECLHKPIPFSPAHPPDGERLIPGESQSACRLQNSPSRQQNRARDPEWVVNWPIIDKTPRLVHDFCWTSIFTSDWSVSAFQKTPSVLWVGSWRSSIAAAWSTGGIESKTCLFLERNFVIRKPPLLNKRRSWSTRLMACSAEAQDFHKSSTYVFEHCFRSRKIGSGLVVERCPAKFESCNRWGRRSSKNEHIHAVASRRLLQIVIWKPQKPERVTVVLIYEHLMETTFDVAHHGDGFLSKTQACPWECHSYGNGMGPHTFVFPTSLRNRMRVSECYWIVTRDYTSEF